MKCDIPFTMSYSDFIKNFFYVGKTGCYIVDLKFLFDFFLWCLNYLVISLFNTPSDPFYKNDKFGKRNKLFQVIQ
jgi:hypothetical protein